MFCTINSPPTETIEYLTNEYKPACVEYLRKNNNYQLFLANLQFSNPTRCLQSVRLLSRFWLIITLLLFSISRHQYNKTSHIARHNSSINERSLLCAEVLPSY